MQFHTLAAPAIAAAALVVSVFTGAGAANSQSLAPSPGAVTAYRVVGPAVHNNLGVYFIRGASAGGPVPLTLDQAVASGAAKIYDVPNGPPAVENLSHQDLFIQSGDLLVGGAQDQVIGSGLIVPPGSGRVPLEVFCVDPFRSTPRPGQDASTFAASGALLASRMARLSMATGSAEPKLLRYVRQLGVWWSIDSLRASLTDALGQALEPPLGIERDGEGGPNGRARVLLEARQAASTTGLPLALRNEALVLAEDGYVDALAQAPNVAPDSIGAVFAINGRLEAAEIYESNALFRAAWPKLLRAYATAALAAGHQEAVQVELPSVQAAETFLASAQPAAATSFPQASFGPSEALYAGVTRSDGSWAHRAYLRRFDATQAPNSPEATMLAILTKGEVNGRAIGDLASYENIVLRSEAGTWQAGIVPVPELTRIAISGSGSGDGFSPTLLVSLLPVVFVLIKWAQVICASVGKRAIPIVRGAVNITVRWAVYATSAGVRSLCLSCREAAVLIGLLLLSALLALVQCCKRLSGSLRHGSREQSLPAAFPAAIQRPTR